MSYLGVPPFGQTVRTVTTNTANGTANTFYPTGGYIVGYLDVFYNGVRVVDTNTDKPDLEEQINEALNKINEELCPAGKAYRKRRMAAGEKSSAYLSGRAVKVCKGQMSGKAKKK